LKHATLIGHKADCRAAISPAAMSQSRFDALRIVNDAIIRTFKGKRRRRRVRADLLLSLIAVIDFK